MHERAPSPAQTDEFQSLVQAAALRPAGLISGRLQRPHPRWLVGQGKLEQLRRRLAEGVAELVVFNHELAPRQQNHLERELGVRVVDRIGLILDIFARRASSHAGRLQVELAHLQYLSNRLKHGWTHLERQQGGIGMRGPGEAQLETDRRLVRDRIRKVRQRLERVHRQRSQARHARRRASLPVISLVGYTNAGKSTLFNALTGARAAVADQPFLTLDTCLRRLDLKGVGAVAVADTVGFIRQLPTGLIEAFKATLEEITAANLLLHVIDYHDDEYELHVEQVEQILEQIGAAQVPCLRVYNKVDCRNSSASVSVDASGVPQAVWISAARREGLETLRKAMAERLARRLEHCHLTLQPHQARLRSRLYEHKLVVAEHMDADGSMVLELHAPSTTLRQLLATA